MVRRHYHWGRDRSNKGGAAHPTPIVQGDDGRDIARGPLPLRYAYAADGEQREIVLERTQVRLRRMLEARMTMTMTVPNDHYLGVAIRKGWDGDTPVLVHADKALSLPLPALYGVAPDCQAAAWAEALGVAHLKGPARVGPRRKGNPLTRRTAAKTGRRRHAVAATPTYIAGFEISAPA